MLHFSAASNSANQANYRKSKAPINSQNVATQSNFGSATQIQNAGAVLYLASVCVTPGPGPSSLVTFVTEPDSRAPQRRPKMHARATRGIRMAGTRGGEPAASRGRVGPSPSESTVIKGVTAARPPRQAGGGAGNGPSPVPIRCRSRALRAARGAEWEQPAVHRPPVRGSVKPRRRPDSGAQGSIRVGLPGPVRSYGSPGPRPRRPFGPCKATYFRLATPGRAGSGLARQRRCPIGRKGRAAGTPGDAVPHEIPESESNTEKAPADCRVEAGCAARGGPRSGPGRWDSPLLGNGAPPGGDRRIAGSAEACARRRRLLLFAPRPRRGCRDRRISPGQTDHAAAAAMTGS